MQNAPEINKADINRFLCPGCGANMVFDAALGKLACPYCEQAVEIAADGTVDERDYNHFTTRAAQNLQPMAVNAMQVNCGSCGATVNFTPPETATSCAFCGGKIVAQPKAADPLVAPEGVLPFSVPPPQAIGNFKAWIGSLWFAPSALRTMATSDRLSSVYIPYWTYDAATQSSYNGERGDYYYETENYEEGGEQRTRQVRHTRWSHASGHVDRHFDDVCVPATTSLSEQYLRKLEPWDLDQLKSYEPAFLSGHRAQTYQITLDAGFEKFTAIAASVIDGDVRRDIGGDEQRVSEISTEYGGVTFKHLLLPIYAGAYRFNDKIFQIVVNGRTGEVQGERPYSWLKIGCLVLFILGVIVVLVALIALLNN
jgi:ribosomal protein S27E